MSPLTTDERAQMDRLLDALMAPATVHVTGGSDLQAAYDAAPDGAVLYVEPGEYAGLDAKRGNVTVRTTVDAVVFGGRIDPSMAGALPKLRGSVNNSAIVLRSGVRNATFIGLQTLPGPDVSYAQIVCGDPEESDPTKAATGISFLQCLSLADPVKGGKRGLALNCGAVSVRASYVAGFWAKDDAQAICGWNGPGPFDIQNCSLSASGEVVIFGGADPKNQFMQPGSLSLAESTLTADVGWRGNKNATRKNGLELKNMIGAQIHRCIIENSWASGQAGALVLITPRNQSGTAPYSTVTDVWLTDCVLRHAGAGFQIQGDDNEHQSARVQNVRVHNVLLYDLDPKTYNNPFVAGPDGYASGRLIQLTRSPVNVSFDRLTAIGSRLNSFLNIDGPGLADGFQITNSVLTEGKYGMLGPIPGSSVFGVDAWAKFVSNGTLDGNLIARAGLGLDKIAYPGTNTVSLVGEGVVDSSYRVLPKYARAGLGCDLTTLPAFS